MLVLELFAGTRSISKAFERRHHDCITIEWDKQHPNITLYADINNVSVDDIKQLCRERGQECPDVVWASPDCFAEGTMIWTKNGYKDVKDIRCFDEVLTHKNRLRRVYATQKTNKYDMYEYKISGCESNIVSSEHPFYVRKKGMVNTHKNGEVLVYPTLSEPQWLKISELTTEYKVGIPINQESKIPEYNGCIYTTSNHTGLTRSQIVNTLGPEMSNPNFWWFVGRYIGDGSLSVKKSMVVVSCAKDETDEIKERLDKTTLKYGISYDKTSTNRFNISSKELTEWLSQFGIGALHKKITPTILDLPKELLKEFVDGYISADGHWDMKLKNPYCTISTVSRELAYGFQLCLLKAYDRYGSLVKRTPNNDVICGRKVNVHQTYTVSFYRDHTKRLHYKIEDGICWVNVRSVKKLTSRQTTVYNFSVEDDESYTANNVIVHNCSSYSVASMGHHRVKNTMTGELDPKTDYAKFCDRTNAYVIQLIRQLNPKFFFIENPRAGLRTMKFMQGIPRYTVTYCQYGYEYMKPTDIWTNHPNPQFKPPCHYGDPCHQKAPRGTRNGLQGIKGAKDRSRIPDELCDHIVSICEQYINQNNDTKTYTQTKLF